MDVTLQTMFGCSLRDLTAQFGMNQNPTVYNIAVVQDSGQTFTLARCPHRGIRRIEHIQLGALDIHGLVQAWDEQKVNIAGTGVFSVRITDTRPALEAVQVFLQAPVGALDLPVSLGENVVGVVPETSEDLNSGLKYAQIKRLIEQQVFVYGPLRFRVNLGDIVITPRTLEGEPIDYRIRGSAMSLVEFLNQVADDFGFEWFVETAPGPEDVYTVHIRVLNRAVSTLDMSGLAAMHQGEVIRLVEGAENRDEVARTVLIGAPQQYLSQEPGNNWKAFWGFTETGGLLAGPEFRLMSKDGTPRRRVTSIAEMEKALNGEITSLPEDELNALRSYADQYLGRQFYAQIRGSFIDDNGEPWIDVASAGWWSTTFSPENLPKEGQLKFGTEDGRWTSFAVLKSPSTIGGTWDPSVTDSQGLLTVGHALYYMKADIERVDLHEIAGYVHPRESIFLLTLPTPLAVTVGIHESGTTVSKTTRMRELGRVYLALLDRRRAYGPWASDSLIPEAQRLHGRTRVMVDSSLAPWTFGYRGGLHFEASRKMNAVARARLRTYTCRLNEIDTGELEVADLPAVNLGTAIGQGTNITNISAAYDTRGIRTVYKCNIYTGELGRYQRYYQELLDKFRRDVQRMHNTNYPQPDYWTTGKELRALKKDIGKSKDGTNGASSGGEQSLLARVVKRYIDGPYYDCEIQEQVVVNGTVRVERARTGGFGTVRVTNLSEHNDSPGRIPVDTIVRIRAAFNDVYKTTTGQSITAVGAWVMEENAPEPGNLECEIAALLSPPPSEADPYPPGPPLYRLRVISGDLSPLFDLEAAQLQSVLNLGEPSTSFCGLTIGERVNVSWVRHDVNPSEEMPIAGAHHWYVPFFNVAPQIFYAPPPPAA